MFSQPLLFLLPFLFLVDGQKDTKSRPVDVLQLKHLLIDKYSGPLKYDTVELYRNAEDLHLSFSNFTPFNTSFLLALPNLKRLLTTQNKMEPVDYNITGCCEKIRELELTNIRTGDLLQTELKMIKEMKSLDNLVIQNKRFSTITKDMLMSPKLMGITIIGCQVTTIEDNAFSNLNKLKTLDLKYNSIVKIKKDVLAPLKNVTVIDLKGNYLEELTTEQFPSLPNLEILNVAYNPITRLNLEGIKEIAPKLKTVDITGTFIVKAESDGGVQLFKEAGPQKNNLK